MSKQLVEIAKSHRGQGWLGAVELLDCLDRLELDNACVDQIKQKMHQEIAQQILGGDLGCDEWAMTVACNQCIEAAVVFLDQKQ